MATDPHLWHQLCRLPRVAQRRETAARFRAPVQGLGKLPHLADLEFGSNSAELAIECPGCLPLTTTHLSLEHCRLSRLPDCITRLTQV